jgi:phosphohistidine phosphatase
MKTVILIRHAKSDWDDPGCPDCDRPLNERGRSDCPRMGERLEARLNERGVCIERFICSSARRAIQTAALLTPMLEIAPGEIDFRSALYLASPRTMLEAIRSLPDQIDTIALLAHNPGISELAEQLSGRALGNVPTCGIVTLALPIDCWRDAGPVAELIDFDYPTRTAHAQGSAD